MRAKRPKWDSGGDGSSPAPPNPQHLRQKAEAAAAKIVAQIKEDKAQSEDVLINDQTIAIRDQLTRRAALVYVEQQTGASVIIKGRYYPPGAFRDSVNPPLHLHITPQNHLGTDKVKRRNAVARAAEHIRAILRGEATLASPVPPYLPHGAMQPPPDLAFMPPHQASMPHMEQQPYLGMARPQYMHHHGLPGPSMQPPGLHTGMPPQHIMHEAAAAAGGPATTSSHSSGAGMWPPPMAHAALSGESILHGDGHQSRSQQQNIPPQMSAAPQHRTIPPVRYQPPSSHHTGSFAPSGGGLNGQHVADAAIHSNSGWPHTVAPHEGRADRASRPPAQSHRPWDAPAHPPDYGQVVVLPLDFPMPPGFDAVGHLRGPDNSYTAHIEQETGARVEVVERSGDTSSPQVHVVAEEPWKRKAAVELVESLFSTVKASADAWCRLPCHSGAAPSNHGHAHLAHAQIPLAHVPPDQLLDGQIRAPQPDQARHSSPHGGFSQPQGGLPFPNGQQYPHPGLCLPACQVHVPAPPIAKVPPMRKQGPPPGLNSSSGTAGQPRHAPHLAAQPPQTSPRQEGGDNGSASCGAAQEKPLPKPAKRKFREFKEEASAPHDQEEKNAEGVQLPSYYKHLREGASKHPPPDIARRKVEEGEPTPGGPGHEPVYGPRNAPPRAQAQAGPSDSDPYADRNLGLGARGGLGSGGFAQGALGLVPYGDD